MWKKIRGLTKTPRSSPTKAKASGFVASLLVSSGGDAGEGDLDLDLDLDDAEAGGGDGGVNDGGGGEVVLRSPVHPATLTRRDTSTLRQRVDSLSSSSLSSATSSTGSELSDTSASGGGTKADCGYGGAAVRAKAGPAVMKFKAQVTGVRDALLGLGWVQHDSRVDDPDDFNLWWKAAAFK